MRGLGAASSVEHRGWARGDEARPSRRRFREALYARIVLCNPACLGTRRDLSLRGEVGGLAWSGEKSWWKYRSLLDAMTGSTASELEVVTTCPGGVEQEPICDLALVIDGVEPDGASWPSPCLPLDEWIEADRVVDPAGEMDALLWIRSDDPGACAGPTPTPGLPPPPSPASDPP